MCERGKCGLKQKFDGFEMLCVHNGRKDGEFMTKSPFSATMRANSDRLLNEFSMEHFPSNLGFSLAVTGGIACGKSTVTNALTAALSAKSFNADGWVHHLLKHDELVIRKIIQQFPAASQDGLISRPVLRNIIFENQSKRVLLESILHPRVLQEMREQKTLARAEKRCFIAEIPLLFEVGVANEFDIVILVGCTPSTQKKRLHELRGFTAQAIEEILQAQWPIEKKIILSDKVLWNDGSLDSLQAQVHQLLAA